jgi:hypothetical protein
MRIHVCTGRLNFFLTLIGNSLLVTPKCGCYSSNIVGQKKGLIMWNQVVGS